MSNFPNQIDTDIELPPVNDNITEIGGEAINALRDAVFNLESNVGINAHGTMNSIAERLGVAIDLNGQIKASAITSLGLVSLPIYDNHIASSANISESKLNLDHPTQQLYNYISYIDSNVYGVMSFISDTGSKIEPHLDGYIYRHAMSHIDVASPLNYFKNNRGLTRDNTNLYNLFFDLNDDYINHQNADAITSDTIPPDNYAHVASGIFLNTANFSYIPQTTTNIQQFAQFVDQANLFLLGSRIQTLYSNGIPRTARSGAFGNQNFGTLVVPTTAIKTYLLNNLSNTPVDNIDNGDDIVEFFPVAPASTSGLFDTQFSQIKVGDILNLTYSDGYGNGPDGYGSPFIIQTLVKSKKPLTATPDKRYVLRINTKNLYAGIFTAEIFRPQFSTNKYGVLSTALANAPSGIPSSLIIGNPRSAQTLGIGFEPDQIDSAHYNLYLVLYPNGNPQQGIISLPAIDISGNRGATPGSYTLENVVTATNTSLREAGFNLRFMAFSYRGAFGIMMTDPYNNAGFSIISGSLSTDGSYDQSGSTALFTNNVVGVPGFDYSDALGFSNNASASASPNYSFGGSSSAPTEVAQIPTKIFTPLIRNNYYINGAERDKFAIEPFQQIDGYGDAYWSAKIINKTIIPATRVETTYQIEQNLSTSSLKIGKTLVVLADNNVDSGRFFIKEVQFNNCDCDGYGGITNITVYDSVHATGNSPYANAAVESQVKIYFGADSIAFNVGNVTDLSTPSVGFKRFFEIYVDEFGSSFSNERARFSLNGNTTINGTTFYAASEINIFDIVAVSPKLKGYTSGNVTKIGLQINSYNKITGVYTGNLYNSDSASNFGPVTIGKVGIVTRFYDESNIDYIDFYLDRNIVADTWNTVKIADIQLFPSLQLNEEIMIISSAQYNDLDKKVSRLTDLRQFGNVSEKQLSTSALDFISASNKFLNENGIIEGFNVSHDSISNKLSISGGTALVNGAWIQMNPEYVNIPIVRETLVPYGGNNLTTDIEWVLCVNDKYEYEFIAFSDYLSNDITYSSVGVNFQRMFYLYDPNNLSQAPYTVRSGTWIEIISENLSKNITPIALIQPTIVGDDENPYEISIVNIIPAHRYIGNGYDGLQDPFVLGKSFRSIETLNLWIERLGNYASSDFNSNRFGTEVKVTENYALTATPNTKYKITFIGAGGKITLSNSAIKSNLEFKNIYFEIPNSFGARLQGSNISFKECYFNYTNTPIANYNTAVLNNPASAAIYCLIDDYSPIKNIDIINCKFQFSGADHHPAISFVTNSSNAYLENINIINNNFSNKINADDKRSVIAFTNKRITAGLGSTANLININIRDNICDKNQMIILSSDKNGSNNIATMFIPTGVNIVNNICGSICFMFKQRPSGVSIIDYNYNDDRILDKENIVNIIDNKCLYIFSGNSDGFLNCANGNVVNTTQMIIAGSNIYSASLNVCNNIVNWIQIGVKMPIPGTSFNSPQIKVNDNNQMPRPIAFLTPYFNGVPAANIGLQIEVVEGD